MNDMLPIENGMPMKTIANQLTEMSSLSVIVPTIWACKRFPEYILSLADHCKVREIIVVDNNFACSTPLDHPKIRVLVQKRNIFVNPAWNLGVKAATGKYLCLLNDDIFARHETYDFALNLLKADVREAIGIIGLAIEEWAGELRYSLIDSRPRGFGCLMFLRARDYRPIPRALKIWCGDDYLLTRTALCDRKALAISGYGSQAPAVSVSVKSLGTEIADIRDRDLRLFQRYISRWLRLRFHPSQAITAFLRNRASCTRGRK